MSPLSRTGDKVRNLRHIDRREFRNEERPKLLGSFNKHWHLNFVSAEKKNMTISRLSASFIDESRGAHIKMLGIVPCKARSQSLEPAPADSHVRRIQAGEGTYQMRQHTICPKSPASHCQQSKSSGYHGMKVISSYSPSSCSVCVIWVDILGVL